MFLLGGLSAPGGVKLRLATLREELAQAGCGNRQRAQAPFSNRPISSVGILPSLYCAVGSSLDQVESVCGVVSSCGGVTTAEAKPCLSTPRYLPRSPQAS